MRFRMSSLVAGAALMAAPITSAGAQWNLGSSTNMCGGSEFTFCFSLLAQQKSATTFWVTLANNALNGSNAGAYANLVFTQIGFVGLTSTWSFTSSSGTSFSPSSNLTPLSDGPGGIYQGATANAPGPKNGLLFGESITFVFENTTYANFAGSYLGIHAQAGPGGCSSKIFVNDHSTYTNPAPSISAACGGTTTTGSTSAPEPASYVLMATGLAGILGVGTIRRRRTI